MLETGDISIRRFPKVGNYASYCRCVPSERSSNKKKKGENNRKNGNKYLAWAYVEAANFATRYCSKAKRFYQRKSAKTNNIVATKALAHRKPWRINWPELLISSCGIESTMNLKDFSDNTAAAENQNRDWFETTGPIGLLPHPLL